MGIQKEATFAYRDEFLNFREVMELRRIKAEFRVVKRERAETLSE